MFTCEHRTHPMTLVASFARGWLVTKRYGMLYPVAPRSGTSRPVTRRLHFLRFTNHHYRFARLCVST